MGEFDFITRYFQRTTTPADPTHVQLGIGDDCALLVPSTGMSLAISTDMLLESRHFLPTIAPQRLGHKSLAVNLSDLAAMGAKPLAFTLSLALPRIDPAWCEDFAKGLFALADEHQCTLIGGDTTAGPLCISITVFGEIPHHLALRRSAAQAGDDIYVSHPIQGGIGDARLALETLRSQAHQSADAFEQTLQRMEQPTPRVALGMALRNIATSAIDLSDGLLGDLGHILKASQMGASIEVDSVPRSHALHNQPVAIQRLCTLSGGDDYELIFTAPIARRAQVLTAAHHCQLAVTPIGRIEMQPGVRLYDARGNHVSNSYHSFDHFKN